MTLPADAAASEPFQKYEKELTTGLGGSSLSPAARGSSVLSHRGPDHEMLPLCLRARPNLRHRFLGHRGYARNVDASSQMETSCQGRQHLQQHRLSSISRPTREGKVLLAWGGKGLETLSAVTPSTSDAPGQPPISRPSCPFLAPLCAEAMSPLGSWTQGDTGMGTDHPPDTTCVLAGGFYSPTS